MSNPDPFERLKSSWRRPAVVALVAGFWIVVGAAAGLAQFAAASMAGAAMSFSLAMAAPGLAGLLWIPITLVALDLVGRYPVSASAPARVVVHGVAAIASGFALNLGFAVVESLGSTLPLAAVPRQALVASLRWLHVNTGAYLGIVACAHAFVLWSDRRHMGATNASEVTHDWAQTVVVHVAGRTRFVDVDTVDRFEGAGDYVRVHTGGEEHLSNERLTTLERTLDPGRFVRVHRSSIINVERVRELRALGRGDYEAVLACGATVRVSRRRRAALRNLLDRRSGAGVAPTAR